CKLHKSATPAAGGIAVFVATLLAVALVPFINGGEEISGFPSTGLIGVLLACSMIVAVGVLDDAFGMRGRQKLAGQLCAALTLCYFGLVINNVQIFSWEIQLGLLAVPFTVIWLLGAINAIN